MTSDDSDQPAHLRSLIRVFADCMCLLQPKEGQQEPLPSWVDVQIDLSLCWSHRVIVGFVMHWLVFGWLI